MLVSPQAQVRSATRSRAPACGCDAHDASARSAAYPMGMPAVRLLHLQNQAGL